jgi:hypothetical protein
MCWPFDLSAGFADGYWVRILPPAGQHHLIYMLRMLDLSLLDLCVPALYKCWRRV